FVQPSLPAVFSLAPYNSALEKNPIDGFIRVVPNRALERFINTNKLSIQVEGLV
ncbi:hypothetical protein CC86DRAFT_359501, partial [Ophiobolus disseminans]